MEKVQRNPQQSKTKVHDDNTRHYFKIQKTHKERKLMKNLDNALRSKNYTKLLNLDSY